MNKNFIYFALLFVFASTMYAQDKEPQAPKIYLLQGDLFVEGVLGFSNETNELEEFESSSYTINPKIGYFIQDDFALGLDFSYQYDKNENSNRTLEEKTMGISVFGRYYFLDFGKRFKVYGEADLGYVTSESGVNNQLKAKGFGAGAGLGLNYFVTDNIAISFVLADILSYRSVTYDSYTQYLDPDSILDLGTIVDEKKVSSFNADINVFNNFFQTARFGVMFKF